MTGPTDRTGKTNNNKTKISQSIYSLQKTRKKQQQKKKEIIALNRHGTQQQRPKSPTVINSLARWRYRKRSRPHSVSDYNNSL